MTQKIDVSKTSRLARLKLTSAEEKEIEKRFETILSYFDILTEIEVKDGTAKEESLQKIGHEDRPDQWEGAPEDFSETVENKFFKVPKIIE